MKHKILLMAAMLFCVTCTFTSCNPDDNDDGTENVGGGSDNDKDNDNDKDKDKNDENDLVDRNDEEDFEKYYDQIPGLVIDVQPHDDIKNIYVGNGLMFTLDSLRDRFSRMATVVRPEDFEEITHATVPQLVRYNNKKYIVQIIAERAFSDCHKLESVELPTSIYIDEWAFAFSRLKSITLPQSMDDIPNHLFKGCADLESITIPNSVTTIRESAFQDCTGLTSVTFGRAVKEIGRWAFWGCSGLKEITIPEPVTTIVQQSFRDCTGLESVTIGNSVTTIGYWAFGDCSGLKSLTVGSAVTDIADMAFSGCTSLEELTSLNPTPPEAEYNTFDQIPTSTCVLKVPASAVNAYKKAYYWKRFTHIVGIEQPLFVHPLTPQIWKTLR